MDFINNILSAPLICIGWIIVGAIAGSLARSIMRGPDRPFIADVALGIIGAIVGGIVAGILGMGPSPTATGLELVLINLVIATIGAIILIAIGRAISGRSVT